MFNFKLKSYVVRCDPIHRAKSRIETYKSGYWGIALCIYLTRTSLVISSSDLRKIIRARSNQNKLLFIGLNESSHQELFNQSICFEKFQIFQKLSWKN